MVRRRGKRALKVAKLMRRNCKVSSTSARVAAIRVEDRSVTARAEAGIVNVRRRDSPLDQQRGSEARQVDMRLHPAAIDEPFRLGIRIAELIDDFLADFETADADGRPEPSLRGGTDSADGVDRFRRNL